MDFTPVALGTNHKGHFAPDTTITKEFMFFVCSCVPGGLRGLDIK